MVRSAAGRRLLLVPLGAAAVIVAAVLALPQGRLACNEPYAPREASPDGQWTLTLCRRPMLFAMPGGASDAPGWLMLRDPEGAIRSVSSLQMVQLYWDGPPGLETVWEDGRVRRTFVVDLPLEPASGPLRRWLDNRLWRLGALFGWTPSDEDVR